MTNTLYFGDNLHVLREHIADESVDLIYLDPPFNSNANYNILFKSPEGQDSDAQIELRRVLKSTGSLYLHCDSTASHYLKLLLDGVFGATSYRNEIVWKRTSSHGNVSTGYGDVTDTIFYYSKGGEVTWNNPMQSLSDKNIAEKYTFDDGDGRLYTTRDMRNPSVRPNLHYEYTASNGVTYQPHPNGWTCTKEKMEEYDREGRLYFPKKADGRLRLKLYLDDHPGQPMQTLWDDIPPINSRAQERLGYPTQKPLALLERIIEASSNEGDVVLDPFCGCGTAVHAAQKLDRQWIGIDVTHLAIGLIEKRMKEAFPELEFEVKGRPQSLASAEDLAKRDKHQFELWALSVVDADPWKGGRKGPDGGIDGIIWFKPDGRKTEKAIVEVKGGGTGVKDVGRLAQVMERENAKIGVLITAQLPTRAMERDAAAVGVWENEYTGRKHPRLQIITLAELFQNKRPDIPWVDTSLKRKARREDTKKQGKLI